MARDEARLPRRLKRNGGGIVEKKISEVNVPVAEDPTNDEPDDELAETNAIVTCTEMETSSQVELSFKDIGIQVNTGDLLPNFIHFVRNDSELTSSTGIENFGVLHCIVNLASRLANDKIESGNVKMNLHDRIVLTYVKLKQNISYAFLAVLFQRYTAAHCSIIFHDTIKLLSCCLKVAIPWSSKEGISKNLPTCFKGFEDTRVVLDCIEIFIQDPSNLCCQIVTYSHYKQGQTCKIMTGVTPAGNISFISNSYGGRTSDKAIFENSAIVKLLEPGDAVMVDRGFLIDEICKLNNWKCIRPPFLKGKTQFSKSESELTAKIARARVHVERSNQRIKLFKMMADTMPVNLVNLSSPIIKDDKFMTVTEVV